MNFVNAHQDNKERIIKYAILKGLGLNSVQAQRMRDFTWRNWGKRVLE